MPKKVSAIEALNSPLAHCSEAKGQIWRWSSFYFLREQMILEDKSALLFQVTRLEHPMIFSSEKWQIIAYCVFGTGYLNDHGQKRGGLSVKSFVFAQK